MVNHFTNETSLRLLLPETLWLEPEYFEQARQSSYAPQHENQQWQVYLNTLAMLALETWLKEQIPKHSVKRRLNEGINATYLRVGEFILCLIATEHVLDEIVHIPKLTIEQPELAAHFYVLLEVMEEQEQVIIRGFLRYDELIKYYSQCVSLSRQSEVYSLPLSVFDPEINHLVFSIHHLYPNRISLPTASSAEITTSLLADVNRLKVHLSQWLQGFLDEGWQAIDTLTHPEINLAWSTRQTSLGTKGGKLLNFGVQLDHQTVALLVTATPETEGKIGIIVQVLPVAGAQILPTRLKLTLLSSTETILQEVQSREQDNYIQLKPFKGKPGVNFSIEISLNDVKFREVFEL